MAAIFRDVPKKLAIEWPDSRSNRMDALDQRYAKLTRASVKIGPKEQQKKFAIRLKVSIEAM